MLNHKAVVSGIFLILLVAVSGCTSDETSSSMSAADVKAQAVSVTSEELQRNAQDMVGKPIKITGKVFDIGGNTILIFTGQEYGYWTKDVVYINVKGNVPGNIIDDDIITIYAVVKGKIEYTTAIGGVNKVPEVDVYPENIEISG